jgi:hypothetical protein
LSSNPSTGEEIGDYCDYIKKYFKMVNFIVCEISQFFKTRDHGCKENKIMLLMNYLLDLLNNYNSSGRSFFSFDRR